MGVEGLFWGHQVCRGILGADRDCRYSDPRVEASGGIGGLLVGVGAILGCWRHQGV